MKNRVIRCLFALLLACCATFVRAQSVDDSQSPPVCTDLTGKVPLPCPSSRDTVTTLGDEDESTPAPPAINPSKAPPGGERGRPENDSRATSDSTVKLEAAPAPAARRDTLTTQPAISQAVNPAQPAVRPASAPQPVGSAVDPRAAIGLYPKTRPEPDPEPVQPAVVSAPRPSSMERDFVRNLFRDQKDIWTSPLHLRLDDLQWFVPLLAAGAIAPLSDTAIEEHLPTSTTLISRSKSFSDYGALAFAGIAGSAWWFGAATHNDHMRETGLLSGEAALNSFALTYAIKSISQRDRPFQGDGRGRFFSNGDSFPSEHAAFAWSVATVIAHEYPGPLTALFAYGGAGAVSAARVLGRQHFTSDALIGSAVGYFVGRHVYNAHNNRQELQRYGTFERAPRPESARTANNMGSAYVPLDSWVYGAFDRLAALGYLHTAFAGLRPWTRLECLRLLEDVHSRLDFADGSTAEQARQLYAALQAEFVVDSEAVAGGRNVSAELESFYTRLAGISGKPLTDGYHFGQTLVNDYGRPYQEGFNAVTGLSARAEAGPLAFYVRGEYQHAPSGPALPDAARQTISAVDFLPSLPPATPAASIDRFRFLDAYLALKLHNWEFSFGRQSLSWGPGVGGAMMLSNDAAPIDMLRFNRVSPIQLPWIFRWLGPIRTDFFLGRLSGYQFVENASGLVGEFGRELDPQPSINGMKFSFQPTANLEIGFSRTTIYGGPGYPFTEYTLGRSIFATTNERAGAPNKPGDRRSGMDISYRVPGLRNWLTFYADGFTDDEYSPVAYFDRSAWHAGLYLARLPRLPKLDLRAEGMYTDNPLGGNLGHGFYYFNFTWRNGYTNDGNLIGSWIGRQGQGAQAWATYHLNARNSVEANFRHQKISNEFIPGGGTITDVGLRAELWTRSNMNFSTLLQYEKWTVPVLALRPQSNVTTSVQFTYRPHWGIP